MHFRKCSKQRELTWTPSGRGLEQPFSVGGTLPILGPRGRKDGWHRLGRPKGALQSLAGVLPRALLQNFDDGILLQDLGMKRFQPGGQESNAQSERPAMLLKEFAGGCGKLQPLHD